MKQEKKSLVATLIMLFISLIFTVVVKFVDVEAIGPMNTEVGFASLNGKFRDIVGTNEICYAISKYLGLALFLLVAFFALTGVLQMIKRKSLLKVDKTLLALGGIYIVFAAVYVLFSKVAISYRPILEEGQTMPESSFPSTHTMMAIMILGTGIIQLGHMIKNEKTMKFIQIIGLIIMVVIIITRFLSGVHWLTDIIAGILYGDMFVFLFKTVCLKLK